MFPSEFLYKLHRVMGMSPRQISELHKEMLGFTIRPHGVRTYLKAYGIFEPRTRGRGSKGQAEEYKEVTAYYTAYSKKWRVPEAAPKQGELVEH